ncbi:MAG TPA: DUF4398 domain-containing protein [Methylobacter sp.]
MKNHRYHLIILFAVAIVSGCTTMPKNASLTEAHNSFNNVRTNPDVINLAALELKAADDTLKKADAALEDDETVNQLAYLAKHQVAVAEETAKQKAAELAIAYATAKRTQIQLQARTALKPMRTNSNSRSYMSSKPNEEDDYSR